MATKVTVVKNGVPYTATTAAKANALAGGGSSSSSSSSGTAPSRGQAGWVDPIRASGDTRFTDKYGTPTDAQIKDANVAGVPTGPITSSTLTPTPSIPNIPPPAPPSSAGTDAMTKASGLASGAAATGTTPPVGPTPAESLQKLIDSTKQAPNAEKIYQKTEQEVQLQQKQAAVNNFQNQINAITAKANADKLSLVGQGRGVTDVIIGGQQAQIDREAAIQALPISAQLAAAQGDLATAQDHLDTLFKIRLQDATNKVDYSNKVASLVYNYATDQQKLALDAKSKADDRAFQLTTNTLNYAQSLATAALNNGQSTLAASIMRLDPNSPNYAKDVASYAGSISVAPTQTQASITRSQANDVASAVLDFQNQMKAKGWAGANPDAYNYYRSELAATYGASAALALDEEMQKLGIEVDYANK